MKTARYILLSIFIIYAALSVYFISINNKVGFLLFYVLILHAVYILFIRDSVTFIKLIIYTIPILGLFPGGKVIVSILLMLPLIVVIYFKQLVNGYRILQGRKDIIFYGMYLMFFGVVISLLNAFLRGIVDFDMVIQTGLLIYELILLLLIISLIDTSDKFGKLLYSMQVPAIVLTSMVILYSIYSNIATIMYTGKNFIFWGVVIHANLVAMILTPLIMLSLPVLLSKKNIINTTIYYMLFTLSMMSLIFTNARGAWVGFFCASCYIFVRLRKSKYLLVMLCIVFVVGLVLSNIVVSRYSHTNKSDMSILARFTIWYAAIKYITSNPLVGLGPDYFRIEKYKLGVPANIGPFNSYSTHNMYLEVAVNYSCLFLIGFLFLLLYSFFYIDKRYKMRGKLNNNIYLLSINAAIIAVSIHVLFDCNIANVSFVTVYVILMALALVLVRRPLVFNTETE